MESQQPRKSVSDKIFSKYRTPSADYCQTPFERIVADEASRRAAALNRERTLLRKRPKPDIDIERILARDEYLSQHEKDSQLVRDPHLSSKWTPLFPHPLPLGYELFDNERELRRIAVLAPGDRTLAAAAHGCAWCVEELFIQGCPVDCTQGSGLTPLHIAASRNDADTVRVLLNIGVDVNATTKGGATPLTCAIGGAGGADGECATLLRASDGLGHYVDDMTSPGSILDVPIRRPWRAIDDRAAESGRMVYTGQF